MAVDPLLWQSILVCNFDGTNGQTTFTDDGVKWKQKTLTGVASAALTTTGPKFGTACLSLNGSQRIDITDNADFSFGTSDFTIECWVYITGNSAQDGNTARICTPIGTIGNNSSTTYWNFHIMGDTVTTGTGLTLENVLASVRADKNISVTITQNAWHHISVSKNSLGVYFGLDGNLYCATPITQAVNRGQQPQIGASSATNFNRNLVGKLDSLRILNGVALYTSNYVAPIAEYSSSGNTLLHFNDINGSTTFTDSSASPKTYTGYGTAQISTTQSKFGGSSLYLDGASYIDTPLSTEFDFGSGGFTLECWFYSTAAVTSTQSLISRWDTSGNFSYNLCVVNGNKVAIQACDTGSYSVSNDLTSTATFTINTWNHLVCTRVGNTLSLFLNGTVVASTTISYALYSSTAPLSIGRASGTQYFVGYIDEVRIIKGTALYSTYIVPTAAFDTSGTTAGSWSVPAKYSALSMSTPTFSMEKCGSTTGIMPTGTGNLVTGGSGYLNGTIKFRYPPDLPVSKKVGVMCETSGTFIQYTWSDATTGAYRFDGLNPNLKYSVVAYDDTGTYGASIASGLVPTGY